MEAKFIAFIMAVLLGAAQFSSESIVKLCGRHYLRIISFSAGISITYLFLDLIPQFSIKAVRLNRLLFLSLLAGFVAIHLVEKYIYQHSPRQRIEKQLGLENQTISFFYHFILGIIILDFSKESLKEAILLFIPVLVFTAVSTLPLNRHPDKKVNAVVSTSTVLGVIFAEFIHTSMSPYTQTALLGFIIGGILFSIIRHSIPPGTEGKPLFFFLGVVAYAPFIIAGWLL